MPLSAYARLPLPTSRQGNSTPPMPPMPPVLTSPCTPTHHHPVIPFSPPLSSNVALQHGLLLPPTSFPPVCVTQLQQPFFTFPTTHLPPSMRTRPLSSPLSSFLSPTPATSLTVNPGKDINARPVLPLQTSLQQPLLQPTTITCPRPLQSPTVDIICSNCGHCNVLVNLSGGQLIQPLPAQPVAKASPPMLLKPSPTYPLQPQPVATNTKASPPMFLKPSPSHPPCLIQDPGTATSRGRGGRGGVFSLLRQPLPAQPVAKASPLKPSLTYPLQPMFLKPSPSHPPCLIQDPGTATSRGRGGVFSPLRQPLPAQPVAKASPLKPSPSTETSGGVGSRRRAKRDKLQTGQGISTKSTVSIIPYRERKKKTSPDVYAIQNLELEFAFQQEPTVAHVAELAAKLRVSNRFVHQWFYKRQQRQKAAPPEICCEIIPSGMYDVTVEVPTDEGPKIAQWSCPTIDPLVTRNTIAVKTQYHLNTS